MDIAKLLLLAAGSVSIGATLLALVKNKVWWIRIFDFPRVQILILCLVCMVTYLLVAYKNDLVDNLFIFFSFLSLVIQVYFIWPYTSLAPKQALADLSGDKKRAFSLLVANVLMENRNIDMCLDLVQRVEADIVLFLEPDAWWQKQLKALGQTYPFAVEYPLDNTYGIILFSKLKLNGAQVKFLIEDDVPSIHTSVELNSGAVFDLYCLHPAPPGPTENSQSTERDAELIQVGRACRAASRPAVVAGDMNDVAWSRTTRLFQRLSGLLDPRRGRGFFNTYHARYPILRWPLDHIFLSRHFRVVDLKRQPYWGSDHFPVYIVLSYEPEAKEAQEHPQPNGQDKEEAKQTLAEAKSQN